MKIAQLTTFWTHDQ